MNYSDVDCFFFLAECPTQADIAFLLDGSGSVGSEDFERMKVFVKSLVSSFKGQDTKVGLPFFLNDIDFIVLFFLLFLTKTAPLPQISKYNP